MNSEESLEQRVAHLEAQVALMHKTIGMLVEVVSVYEKHSNQKRKCSVCKEEGHTCKKCPNVKQLDVIHC